MAEVLCSFLSETMRLLLLHVVQCLVSCPSQSLEEKLQQSASKAASVSNLHTQKQEGLIFQFNSIIISTQSSFLCDKASQGTNGSSISPQIRQRP